MTERRKSTGTILKSTLRLKLNYNWSGESINQEARLGWLGGGLPVDEGFVDGSGDVCLEDVCESLHVCAHVEQLGFFQAQESLEFFQLALLAWVRRGYRRAGSPSSLFRVCGLR